MTDDPILKAALEVIKQLSDTGLWVEDGEIGSSSSREGGFCQLTDEFRRYDAIRFANLTAENARLGQQVEGLDVRIELAYKGRREVESGRDDLQRPHSALGPQRLVGGGELAKLVEALEDLRDEAEYQRTFGNPTPERLAESEVRATEALARAAAQALDKEEW